MQCVCVTDSVMAGACTCTALEEGHYSLADELHIALMVNHVAEVGRWMVGVKKLITVLKQQAR